MAATTSSDIAAALSLLFAPKLTRAINDSNVLIHLLPFRLGAGKSMNWTVELAGAADGAAVAESTGRSASDADSDVEVAATLPWAIMDKVASVTGLAEATASSSPNKGSLLDGRASLLGSRASNAYTALLRGAQKALYSGQAGQNPGQIVGLATAVDATGTYANIAQGTYSGWASTESTAAASSFGFGTLQSFFSSIYDASGEKPSFVVCDSTRFDLVKSLYGSNAVPYIREIVMPQPRMESDVLPPDDRLVKLAAGMEAISVDGVPFIRDRDCTSATFYALNTRYVHLEQLPKYRNEVSDEMIMETLGRAVGSAIARVGPQVLREIMGAIQNPTGILPFFHALGKAGDQDTIQAVAYLQLQVTSRHAHGKLALT